MLIVRRGLQGLGAAFVAPAALSILTTTFAEGPQRTKAMGVWAAIATGGAAVGLLLGGILAEYFSWPWIFFVNVPVGIAAFLLSLRYVPESRADAEHRIFDVPGAVTVTAGLIALVYGIVNVQTSGWTSREHDRLRRRRADPAHRLRPDRAAAAGAARPPRHLPRPHAPRREHLDAARRVGAVRDVLLQHALRPARARLLAAPGGSRVPAGDGRDRHRRRALAGRRQAARHPHDLDHRHVDRDRRDAAAAHERRERHVPRGRAPRADPDLDRDGADVRAGDAARDERRRARGRRPRVGALQHLAAGRRRARARDPLHARGQPDRRTTSAGFRRSRPRSSRARRS